MDHTSEQLVPVIEDVTYTAQNYLKRKVIKPEEIEGHKGGEVIDLLANTRSYVGGGKHIASKSPIYDSKADQ